MHVPEAFEEDTGVNHSRTRVWMALATALFCTGGLPSARADDATPPASSNSGDQDESSLPVPAPPFRHFTIELTPLNLVMRRYGGQVELIPVAHHAVQLAGYYFDWTTGTDSHNNHFRGVGGEIGYRYYFGEAGPRGFFLGPSFLAGNFDGIPKVGATVHFQNYGGAFDIGYQSLVLDRIVIGLGIGLQYTVPTADIPHQELPASTVANAGLRPRLLLALGFAL